MLEDVGIESILKHAGDSGHRRDKPCYGKGRRPPYHSVDRGQAQHIRCCQQYVLFREPSPADTPRKSANSGQGFCSRSSPFKSTGLALCS